MTRLYYTERQIKKRAERVLAGVQSGTYTKHAMAYDLLALLGRIDRMREEAARMRHAAAASGQLAWLETMEETEREVFPDARPRADVIVEIKPRARLRRDVVLEGGATIPEGTVVEVWSQKPDGTWGVAWTDAEGNHVAALDRSWLEPLA